LQYIGKILASSINIVASLLENATVLVHCSDGWDRTSQLSSLAQIMIDPHYRTFHGFQILIEKEWISFGHQFALRCGHNVNNNQDQMSPIFIQWLDCIYQLISQYPTHFEFNENILIFIAYHVNTCLYGTFIMNSEKERLLNFIKFKTVSIWTDINSNKNQFINNKYKNAQNSVLTPSTGLYKLKLWEEYFLRWNPYYVMNHGNNIYIPYV
jgi:myotubularin-related protein 1/2